MNLPVGPMVFAAISALLIQAGLRKPFWAIVLPTAGALVWAGWRFVFQAGRFDSKAMTVFVGFSFIWIAIFLVTSALATLVAIVLQSMLRR